MSGESPFHRGEKSIQERLGVGDRIERLGRRMIQPHMEPAQRAFLAQLSTFLVGVADAAGRPWVTLLTGTPGFLEPVAADRLRVQARPRYGDPVCEALLEGAAIGALGLDFPTRARLRVNGRVARPGATGFEIRVQQAFGNCDMYIQTRLPPAAPAGEANARREVRRGKALDATEAALVARADTFFVASQASGTGERTDGVDVSHRGGRPGFVLVAHESLLLFPDYPGNCMFNTLGNLELDPRAGLAFFDFESGDALHLSGEARVLWEPYHVQRFPGAERVVAFEVEETLRVDRALPLGWSFGEESPALGLFEAPALEPPGEPLAPMQLVSIQRSLPETVVHEGEPVSTGIFKRPASDRLRLRWLNLEGDGQADLWGHGGAFRAVYVYPQEHYDYWRRELSREELPPGSFGENFTVEGMLEDRVRVGDVFRVGSALVEVAQPRVPCYKLALKLGLPGFESRFLRSGRVGFYFRVLEEGEVGAGDRFELVGRDPHGMSVRELSELLFFREEDLDGTRRALSIRALAHGWKGSFEERLRKAEQDEAASGFRDFVVRRKQAESETITSFYLEPRDGRPLASFQPGQFLTFELELPGQPEPVLRTYSLSDAPGGDCYRVSIKREVPPRDQPELPPGLASGYFHDGVEEGALLRVGPPRGRFRLEPGAGRSLVLLSGGVGITPLLSMLNSELRSGSGRRLWFVHGARNGRQQAFRAHLRQAAAEHDNLRLHLRYSAPGPEDVQGRDFDSVGHVDVELLKEILPFDDYEFYLVGPPPFMRSLYQGLVGMGVAASRIHYEFFGPSSPLGEEGEGSGKASERDAVDELRGACAVSFARSGVQTRWDPECQTLLELAEREGLSPPFSCRSGICRTCMCPLVEGEVEYVEEPLRRPEAGSVLICVARPKTPVVVDV